MADRPQDDIGPDRRAFIKTIVVSVAATSLGMAACDDDSDESGADDGAQDAGSNGSDSGSGDSTGPLGESSSGVDIERVFPQGLASGDPTPSSLILWTRVEAPDGEAVDVDYEIATDEAFATVVASGRLTVDADTDHTLRLKATGLDAYTPYYYRFRALQIVTEWGRGKTAPSPDDDVPVRFAFASCQDFNGRYYHAWRALTEQLDSADHPIDFVVFLGDYIYETANDPRFQTFNEDRKVEIPDGLSIDENSDALAALTLDDYRALYKQYRSDPYLREAHRRFAFISIWDDHEFADDCWQDHSTHHNDAQGDEKNTERRTASNRAWFEFMPVDVEHDPTKSYPDDIRIYRRLRFGRHMELFLTDERSYRDDHAIPEGPSNPAVGKLTANSAFGARQLVLKVGFDPIEADVSPTMLGETQKSWFLDGVQGSDATWKIWGNEAMLAQFAVDLSAVETLPDAYRNAFYPNLDQWDGYRTERAEILQALSGVSNLVAVSGDLHSFHASPLYADFDAPGEAVGVEFVGAGISSRSFQDMIQSAVDGDATFRALGLGEIVPQLDALIRQACPHFVYNKTLAYGIAVVDLTADAIEVGFHTVNDVLSPDWDDSVSSTRFRVAAGSTEIETL